MHEMTFSALTVADIHFFVGQHGFQEVSHHHASQILAVELSDCDHLRTA